MPDQLRPIFNGCLYNTKKTLTFCSVIPCESEATPVQLAKLATQGWPTATVPGSPPKTGTTMATGVTVLSSPTALGGTQPVTGPTCWESGLLRRPSIKYAGPMGTSGWYHPSLR